MLPDMPLCLSENSDRIQTDGSKDMQACIDFRMTLSEVFKQLGHENKDLMFVTTDVGKSVNASAFKDVFGKRYINVGIAEQNAVGVASGLANLGFDVIFYAYAIFASGRAWEPIRNYICYPNLNVKIIATHGGLNVGEDGPTHQATEDIAIMRALPNMKVLSVDDPSQVHDALKLALATPGPVYVRLGRANLGCVEHKTPWALGKSETLRDGKDAAIIATGLMVKRSLEAAEHLAQKGIECRVINMRCLKPADTEAIASAARETGLIVTAEEHNVFGGLFSIVNDALAREGQCAKVIPVAVQDCFAESGKGTEIMTKYGLGVEDIERAILTSKQEIL